MKTQPAAIVRCLTVQDVIHTVRWTRAHELPLSIRGAGHEVFWRSLLKNGVVIDLSQMRAVTIDKNKRTAQIQAGATAVPSPFSTINIHNFHGASWISRSRIGFRLPLE
jgi:FAD/FMN-containing dehydrogenase